MTQLEPLRLADELDIHAHYAMNGEAFNAAVSAAAELRRLHELNQELLVALKDLINCADTNRDWAELKAARAAITKGAKK
jgi:hypothetical protein